MFDVMTALKGRKAKAESKVARAVKALETAQKELLDVLAAERVMADITGESVDQKSATNPVSDRDKDIAKLLGTSPNDSKSPVELHPVYTTATGDELNLDAFRTALWRLLKKTIRGEEKSWVIKSENGRYWREAVIPEHEDFSELGQGAGDS